MQSYLNDAAILQAMVMLVGFLGIIAILAAYTAYKMLKERQRMQDWYDQYDILLYSDKYKVKGRWDDGRTKDTD